MWWFELINNIFTGNTLVCELFINNLIKTNYRTGTTARCRDSIAGKARLHPCQPLLNVVSILVFDFSILLWLGLTRANVNQQKILDDSRLTLSQACCTRPACEHGPSKSRCTFTHPGLFPKQTVVKHARSCTRSSFGWIWRSLDFMHLKRGYAELASTPTNHKRKTN